MNAGGYVFQPLVWVLRFEFSVLMMIFLVNSSSMMGILSLLWMILNPTFQHIVLWTVGKGKYCNSSTICEGQECVHLCILLVAVSHFVLFWE